VFSEVYLTKTYSRVFSTTNMPTSSRTWFLNLSNYTIAEELLTCVWCISWFKYAKCKNSYVETGSSGMDQDRFWS
jgi:hypothetical protein